MNPETPSVTPVESEVTEEQPWTPPILKKMDIEETALGDFQNEDAFGLS